MGDSAFLVAVAFIVMVLLGCAIHAAVAALSLSLGADEIGATGLVCVVVVFVVAGWRRRGE